ncbi:membrane protein [Paenibacillus abyssi]|uniref:Membrane protein n=2 Tax=Paenibacillus abyssi TaxID=1340531 RepID=A0A917CRS2_9BACL|nr:membrane protein [Paenibacillus abyssi]
MMDWISNVVHLLFEWIQQLGVFGVMLGLMVEVIPSEIVLAYAGYLVNLGSVSFLGAVVFGTIGGTLAQLFVYWIGRYGGRPFLEKYGKHLHINKKHLDLSEEWFNRYGTGMIFFARFVPVIRHAISIPAGITRMPLGKFTLLTTLAVIPWTILFVYLGMQLGKQWELIDEKAAPYVQPAILGAIALAIVYFMIKFLRSRGKTV